ncbi:tryptophan 7-halogenase [Brevundimonas sp.]|uniref:tryptophan 7-halogenase n=1 Tax=Brevundimonas sp. TaxID=1871086 RepID=UPI001AC60AA1|nr:tryptophan 7-halogenase [Brevundimonas sp.]MBN9465585.1 tryptophan 7-halogenase [Brevundimonas sp.]
MATKIWRVQGDGLAAWAAAALLARALPDDHSVLVEDDRGPAAEDLQAVLVEPDGLLVQLADSGDDLMVRAQGGFCLGVLLREWREGRDVAVVEPEPVPAIDGVAVQDIVLRAAQRSPAGHGYAALLEPLQFQARVMSAGKYAHPSAERQSPRSLLRPRLLLDREVLTICLKAAALRDGARSVSAAEAEGLTPFMTIDTRPRDLRGDDDWRGRLGHDRRLSVRYLGGDQPPCVTVRSLPEGLLILTPLRGGGAASLCYAENQTSPEQTRRVMSVVLGDVEVVDQSDAADQPGFVHAPWVGDRLALGPAAVRLGPALGLDDIVLGQQLETLAACLPGVGSQIPACAAAYNTATARDVGHRADRLHLILRQGPQGAALDPFGPDLERRVRQFLSRNGAVTLDGDPYDAQHWAMVMAGLGLTPRRYDVQADRLDLTATLAALGRMVMAFDQTLTALPAHDTIMAELHDAA